MQRLDDLKYFLIVAKIKNVSRASELLGLSQPAFSHALKRLEDELDVTLLNREKTGVPSSTPFRTQKFKSSFTRPAA